MTTVADAELWCPALLGVRLQALALTFLPNVLPTMTTAETASVLSDFHGAVLQRPALRFLNAVKLMTSVETASLSRLAFLGAPPLTSVKLFLLNARTTITIAVFAFALPALPGALTKRLVSKFQFAAPATTIAENVSLSELDIPGVPPVTHASTFLPNVPMTTMIAVNVCAEPLVIPGAQSEENAFKFLLAAKQMMDVETVSLSRLDSLGVL